MDWSSDVGSSDLDGHAIVAQAAERANSRIPTASPATRSSVPATEIEAAAGEDPSMKHFREAIRAEIGAPIYDSWFGKVRLAKDGNVLTLYANTPFSARWIEDNLGNEITYTVQTAANRSEEHTSELQSLMRISYAVFCLKKKKPSNT